MANLAERQAAERKSLERLIDALDKRAHDLESLVQVLEAARNFSTLDPVEHVRAALRQYVREQSHPVPEGHELYETGDEDAPDSIKDRNGDVALEMCKRCGRAESELSEPCHKAEQPQPEPDVGAMADALGAALRSKHAVFLSRRKLVRLVHAMLKSAPKSCPVKDCEYDR